MVRVLYFESLVNWVRWIVSNLIMEVRTCWMHYVWDHCDSDTVLASIQCAASTGSCFIFSKWKWPNRLWFILRILGNFLVAYTKKSAFHSIIEGNCRTRVVWNWLKMEIQPLELKVLKVTKNLKITVFHCKMKFSNFFCILKYVSIWSSG